MPAAARTPASCPAPVGSSGASSSSAASRAASAGSNGVRSVHDSSVDRARHRGDVGHDGPHPLGVLAAGVQPGRDVRRDGVDAVRGDVHLAAGGDGVVALGRGAGGQHDAGEGEHRVVAVGEPGGARVVGPAGQVEAPAAVRVDRGADGDGPAQVDQRPALLDVQLDERADPAQRLRVGPQRRVARPRDGLGHRDAVGVGEPGGPLGGERAGEDPRARAGDAEPRALLVAEAGHAERPRRGGTRPRAGRRARRTR